MSAVPSVTSVTVPSVFHHAPLAEVTSWGSLTTGGVPAVGAAPPPPDAGAPPALGVPPVVTAPPPPIVAPPVEVGMPPVRPPGLPPPAGGVLPPLPPAPATGVAGEPPSGVPGVPPAGLAGLPPFVDGVPPTAPEAPPVTVGGVFGFVVPSSELHAARNSASQIPVMDSRRVFIRVSSSPAPCDLVRGTSCRQPRISQRRRLLQHARFVATHGASRFDCALFSHLWRGEPAAKSGMRKRSR